MSVGLTQYYTATTLDGFIADPNNSLDWLFTRARDEDGPGNYRDFIADVGALAMGSTTYEWILDHEFKDKDPTEWKWPYEIPSWVFTHRELPLFRARASSSSAETSRPFMRKWSKPQAAATSGSSAVETLLASSPTWDSWTR